jgi:hypothetical protein
MKEYDPDPDLRAQPLGLLECHREYPTKPDQGQGYAPWSEQQRMHKHEHGREPKNVVSFFKLTVA